MTNKTVTLSRELVEQWIVDLEGCTAFVVADQIRTALADPVPPAGGDGFDLALKVREALDRNACPDAWMRIAVETSRPLFDELISNATRLQAEVERLKAEWDKEAKEWYAAAGEDDVLVQNLQSELTKARELYDEENAYVTVLREALKDVLNWMDGSSSRAALKNIVDKALSNQSAPADKGQGEPVAWADPLAFSNFKAHAHRGGPYDHEWMWAKPAHAGMVPLYLHAEQPAPVAVVMPERRPIDWMENRGDEFSEGWNACLDELKRLNGIKP